MNDIPAKSGTLDKRVVLSWDSHTSRVCAIRQLQKRPKPHELTTAIQRDIIPALSTGDDGTHRNDQDINQEVLDLAGAARVVNRAKILCRVLDRHALLPHHRELLSNSTTARRRT